MNNIKIGITGLPSAGKTNTLIQVIKMLEEEGHTVGGMITEPILDDKKRNGLYVMDWMTKKRGVLAATDIHSKFMVGKMGVDLDVLQDIGVQALVNACEKADISSSTRSERSRWRATSSGTRSRRRAEDGKADAADLAQESRNPLLQDIRRRDDVRILEVTPINRNLLPYKIMKLMKGELL